MKHKRAYEPYEPETREPLPPCPQCGCTEPRDLGQYLNGPLMEEIYCPKCGRRVVAWGDSIKDVQKKARDMWQDPAEEGPPWDEDGLTLGGGLTEGE